MPARPTRSLKTRLGVRDCPLTETSAPRQTSRDPTTRYSTRYPSQSCPTTRSTQLEIEALQTAQQKVQDGPRHQYTPQALKLPEIPPPPKPPTAGNPDAHKLPKTPRLSLLPPVANPLDTKRVVTKSTHTSKISTGPQNAQPQLRGVRQTALHPILTYLPEIPGCHPHQLRALMTPRRLLPSQHMAARLGACSACTLFLQGFTLSLLLPVFFNGRTDAKDTNKQPNKQVLWTELFLAHVIIPKTTLERYNLRVYHSPLFVSD